MIHFCIDLNRVAYRAEKRCSGGCYPNVIALTEEVDDHLTCLVVGKTMLARIPNVLKGIISVRCLTSSLNLTTLVGNSSARTNLASALLTISAVSVVRHATESWE